MIENFLQIKVRHQTTEPLSLENIKHKKDQKTNDNKKENPTPRI